MSSDNSADRINEEIYRAAVEPLLDTPIDPDQLQRIEEFLEKIESIILQLKSNEIGTAEAIQKLREIS